MSASSCLVVRNNFLIGNLLHSYSLLVVKTSSEASGTYKHGRYEQDELMDSLDMEIRVFNAEGAAYTMNPSNI